MTRLLPSKKFHPSLLSITTGKVNVKRLLLPSPNFHCKKKNVHRFGLVSCLVGVITTTCYNMFLFWLTSAAVQQSSSFQMWHCQDSWRLSLFQWGLHWRLYPHHHPLSFGLYGMHPNTWLNFIFTYLLRVCDFHWWCFPSKFCKYKPVTLIWGNRASAFLINTATPTVPCMHEKCEYSLDLKCFYRQFM